jgi:hypothetical protein
MPIYRCPVCKKPLSKTEYESALGIIEAQKKHLKEEQEKLAQQQAALRKERADLKAQAKRAKSEGLAQGRQQEKERAQRLMAGQKKTIAKLQERVRQLEKGSTPQTEGLEFEETLTARLQTEFADDEVQHEGKGGDILHFVNFDGKQTGIIIYECKRTPRIPSDHIQQAFRAKQTREADFAILVTTGQRKGFNGLAEDGGVLIVAPLGVIPLVSLIREHLIEMLKTKISKEKRAEIAQQLLKYVTSPQFKNPIEGIITRTGELEDMIKEEAKQHARMWETRWEHYQRIKWDSSQIQGNLQLVLHGKEPKPLTYPKPEPLQLLPPSR